MVNNYLFIAINKEKQKIKGQVEATNVDELRMIISYHDYYLVKYKLIKNTKQRFIENKIRTKDIKEFCKNMALMLKTGQSLVTVLELLEVTTTNKTLKEMITFSKTEMLNGKSFSSCIKKYKKYFSNMFISMIEIGEKSSSLMEVFLYLSRYYENHNKIKSKVVNALFYPMILLFLAIIIVFVMSLFVLPMYEGIFRENNIELPLVTKLLFIISNFLSSNLILVLLGLILFILTSILLLTSRKGKMIINSFLSHVPFISKIYKILNIYIISSSLEIMINNKLTIVDAVAILVNSLNNNFLVKKFKWVYDELRRGQTLSKSLDSFKYFPKMFIEMIKNGENANHLALELQNSSEYYYQKVNDLLTKLTVFIEPLMIIFISIFVGGIMASVFIPMLSLLSSIG